MHWLKVQTPPSQCSPLPQGLAGPPVMPEDTPVGVTQPPLQ